SHAEASYETALRTSTVAPATKQWSIGSAQKPPDLLSDSEQNDHVSKSAETHSYNSEHDRLTQPSPIQTPSPQQKPHQPHSTDDPFVDLPHPHSPQDQELLEAAGRAVQRGRTSRPQSPTSLSTLSDFSESYPRAARAADRGTPAAPPQQPVPVMPPNMTKEQMQQAYVKWTQMKNSGVSETDPEFIKLRNLMFVLQRSQHIMKQRLAYQRQQQLAQQQQQQNGAVNAAPNSTAPAGLALNNGQPATNGQANGSVQSPVQNAAQQPQLQQPSQVQTIAVPNVANALLTKDQATLLQNQLSSFQRLAKGQPIPLSVQQQIFASQQAKKSPTPNEALVAASQALD
ncbi:hypothetical protein LTR28_009724, partial [Elasticomyces elasticus]